MKKSVAIDTFWTHNLLLGWVFFRLCSIHFFGFVSSQDHFRVVPRTSTNDQHRSFFREINNGGPLSI